MTSPAYHSYVPGKGVLVPGMDTPGSYIPNFCEPAENDKEPTPAKHMLSRPAVAARSTAELLARRCGVNPAAVPIAALRRAMIASARRVADREIGSEHMLVVDDGSLYERLRIFDCAIISQARDTK